MKKLILCFPILLLIATTAFSQGNSRFILSSRTFHPANANDSLNTIEICKALNITEVDWMYNADARKLNQLKAEGIKYGLAINPQIPDSGQYTTAKFRIKNIDGTPYFAGRMKNWKIKNPYWGCVNNPGFKTLFTEQSVKLVNLGAYSVFVDDALLNVKLQNDKPNNHGCFCDYCLRGFQAYQKQNGGGSDDLATLKAKLKAATNGGFGDSNATDPLMKSYEKFQRVSVVNFLTEWRSRLKNLNPNIVLLANNVNGSWNDIYSIFDGGIAELAPRHLNKAYLDSAYSNADRLNKTQYFTLVSPNKDENFYLMVYNYLNNRKSIIPWDVYTGSNTRRYTENTSNVKALIDMLKSVNEESLKTAFSDYKANGVNVAYKTVQTKTGGKLMFVLYKPIRKVLPTLDLTQLPILTRGAKTKILEANNKNNYGLQVFEVK